MTVAKDISTLLRKIVANKFYIFAILFFVGVILGSLNRTGIAQNQQSTQRSVVVPQNKAMGEMVPLVREVFSEQGWEAAYDLFVEIDRNYGATFSHEIGHVIGDLLYFEFGINGASHCDDTSNYGCYHGIFSRAIAEEGVVVLDGAVEFCSGPGQSLADVGGCLHGLGHGVLAFRGYEETHLIAALGDCERAGSAAAESCYNGVFMEYNGRIMRTVEEGSQIGPEVLRPIDFEDPYEPCFNIPSQFQSACVYELPNWWVTLPTVSPQNMIAFCEEIDPRFSQECAGGVGRILPFSNMYDLAKIQNYCTSFSTENQQMWCLQDVTKVYLGMRPYFSPEVTIESICEPIKNSNLNKECRSINWQ